MFNVLVLVLIFKFIEFDEIFIKFLLLFLLYFIDIDELVDDFLWKLVEIVSFLGIFVFEDIFDIFDEFFGVDKVVVGSCLLKGVRRSI